SQKCRLCCKSILQTVARNIDSPQSGSSQLRFVAYALVIRFLRRACPPATFATQSARSRLKHRDCRRPHPRPLPARLTRSLRWIEPKSNCELGHPVLNCNGRKSSSECKRVQYAAADQWIRDQLAMEGIHIQMPTGN